MVLETLRWLKVNNASYSDIEISQENLRFYEENGGIADSLPSLSYAWDPAANDSVVDAEAPLNEKEHVQEDDLSNDIPGGRAIQLRLFNTDYSTPMLVLLGLLGLLRP